MAEHETIEKRAERYLAALREHPHPFAGLDDYLVNRLALLEPQFQQPAVAEYVVRFKDGTELVFTAQDGTA